MGADLTPLTRLRIVKAIRSVAPSVWRARLRAVLSIDAEHALRNISVPIRYIRATQDKIISLGIARQLQGVVPQLQISDVDGPHFLLLARPDAVARQIRLFASALDLDFVD